MNARDLGFGPRYTTVDKQYERRMREAEKRGHYWGSGVMFSTKENDSERIGKSSVGTEDHDTPGASDKH